MPTSWTGDWFSTVRKRVNSCRSNSNPPPSTIIDKYRQPNAHPQDYIFPVLRRSVHITAQQQYGRVQRTNKRINRYLKLIGEHLHLPITLTTYVARHYVRNGFEAVRSVNIAIISESLGHSSD